MGEGGAAASPEADTWTKIRFRLVSVGVSGGWLGGNIPRKQTFMDKNIVLHQARWEEWWFGGGVKGVGELQHLQQANVQRNIILH